MSSRDRDPESEGMHDDGHRDGHLDGMRADARDQDRFGAHDETLADEPIAEPPVEARAWLAEQRVLHGLLRAMQGADAQAAELRVQRILAATVEADARVLPFRWGIVAAAALLLSLGIGWLCWPERLPAAEAAVARAVEMLAEDVDRRFVLTDTIVDLGGRERTRQEFELTARPGMHFLLEGRHILGAIRAGCDGREAWLVFGRNDGFRRAVPLAEATRLLGVFGDVLDIGYFDVHALVARLPDSFELRTVGRERAEDGAWLLRIEAHGEPRRQDLELKRAEIWCDEATGMITRVLVEAEGRRGFRRRIAFEYQGTVELGANGYSKPW